MKLLFLHGYTQSGPLFSTKTKSLQKSLLKTLPVGSSLSFPTAPHQLSFSDLPGEPSPDASTTTEYFAWWRRDDHTGTYIGLMETWKFLSVYLKEHGPFDGVVGFSQGAALAAMLTAVLEPERCGGWKPEGWAGAHASLRFAVLYSGFIAPKEEYGQYYEPKIATPTLHVLGTLDTVVSEERSLALVASCVEGRREVLRHPGGHYLPAGKMMVNTMIAFVLQCHKKKGEEEEEEEEVKAEDMELPF